MGGNEGHLARLSLQIQRPAHAVGFVIFVSEGSAKNHMQCAAFIAIIQADQAAGILVRQALHQAHIGVQFFAGGWIINIIQPFEVHKS